MNIIRITLAAAIAAFTLTPAFAQDAAIEIDDAYARISPGGSGAVFLVIHNHGDEDDRLIDANVTDDIARKAELHTHVEDADGVMRMIEVKDGFAISAGDNKPLERGGAHVMLMGVEADLSDGDSFPIELIFENAPATEVEVIVDNARKPASGADHDHDDHDHGDDHGDDNHNDSH